MSRVEYIKSARSLVLKAAVVSMAIFGLVNIAKAQAFTEGFENITTLPAAGWFTQNNSTPVGSTGWFQGNSAVFPTQMGPANSYIGANFNNTTGANTISNWLLTPSRVFTNGAYIKFWTRTTTDNPFPDRLEVRLSTNGASTNVGATATAVGDFTTLLLSINPNLTVGGYPEVWTEYTITFTGLPAGGASGRLAFRYYVTNGGPAGDNSNYIGIDSFFYSGGGDPPPPIRDTALDYNGDGKTDFAVTRPNTGSNQITWYINNGATIRQTQWGLENDAPVDGDFDGDDKSDITVYRRAAAPNAFFYTLRSSNGTLQARELGTTGSSPRIVGDYDGDDIDDFAVSSGGELPGQPIYWHYRGSSTVNGGITTVQYGQYGDTVVPGDYDGDNRDDFCVKRDNGSGQAVYLLQKSGGGSEAVVWGIPTDLAVPGDYDGDGKTDFASTRARDGQIYWNVLGRINNNIIHYNQPWGLVENHQVQGDYDGDGKTDIAVWSSSFDPQQNFFYVRKSSDGTLLAVEWGQRLDYAVARFNSH